MTFITACISNHRHSWNSFTGEDAVNETNMMEMTDALVKTGMAAAGYNMVNVVCNGWTGRDPVTHVLQVRSSACMAMSPRPCMETWPDALLPFLHCVHGKTSLRQLSTIVASPWPVTTSNDRFGGWLEFDFFCFFFDLNLILHSESINLGSRTRARE